MNWYLQVLQKYAVFEGRATRQEYWIFTLANTIIGFVILGLGILTGISHISQLSSLYRLALIVPGTAVATRRLHNIGRSGQQQLLAFLPIIDWAFLLIWICKNSYPDHNQYGPNPKETILRRKSLIKNPAKEDKDQSDQ